MKTKLLSLIIVGIGILGLSIGTVTHAYTSALNPHDPATAADSYVINIPDEELKKTLNHIISNVPPLTTRSENQDITVKDARRVGLMYGGQWLDGKGIKDLEGIQYFINVVDLRVSGNTPTNNNSIVINALPLKALTNLKTLNVANNNLPQNILVDIIPHLTNLESLTLTNNRATDLAPILWPLNKLKDLAVDTNRFTNIDPIITKKDTLVSLNINANTLTNQELQKLWNLTNLEILLASAIRPRGSFSDISFIPSLTKLKHLHLSNNPAISSLEPVLPFKSQLLTLILNGNNFNKELFLPQIAQFTHLTRLDTSWNQFHDISSFGGINGIVNEKFALFTTQKSSISTKASIFPNPIKNRDGSIVPITDTADVINVDSTGIPNPQGTHLKITKSGKGTALVTWKAPATPELYKNFSGELTIHYDLDNIKPTATITSEPESSTPTRGPVTLTLQASEAIQAPAGWKEVPWSNGTTFTKEVTANGVVSLTITDLAGNPSENPITFEVTNIDTTGPEITITDPASTPAKQKEVSASVTEWKIAWFKVVPAWTTCDASLAYEVNDAPSKTVLLSSESDNGKIVCFKALDALGNESFNASSPVSGIDVTDPTITSARANIDAGVNSPVLTFEWQDASGIKEWKIIVDDGAPTRIDGALNTYTLSSLTGSSHVIKIQAVDHADNISAERILRFPPSVKITSPKVESNQPIAGVSIEISWPAGLKIKKIEVSGARNPAFTCVPMPSDTNLVEVPFTCTLDPITATGKLEVEVTSEDGIIGSSEQDYVIDTVNPILTLTSVDALQQGSDYITKASSTTVIFTATDAGGATANLVTECSLDNGNSWEECTSPYTLQLPTATTTLKIRAKDGTGNLSPEKEITIKKDTQAPAFNPSNLPKIIARKGRAIVIDDVTADDGIGGSGLTPAGVTTNVNTLGLDPANPAPGNYILVYTAEDKVGNITTANREVEITDADALIAKVAEVTPALLNGKTPASIAAVNQAKQEAEAIIANVTATQAQIDQAFTKLQDAISKLTNINNSGNNNGNNNWNSSSSSGFSGWGGGWAALIRDHCPQGDNSPSYYDNSCGTAQDSDQTQDQNPDRQSPAIPTDNEMIDAYKRAFENGITTQPSLADARLLDYLTRAELAKMLSIFTLKYTDRQPILDKPFCDTYTDADQVNAELSSYMTTACKLEIMGLHSDGKTPLDAFMPNKHVSRAELVTVLSRVLYGNTYDNNTTDQRWQGHMDKLHTDAVIKDPTPTIQEIRAYVLLMMYRIKGK